MEKHIEDLHAEFLHSERLAQRANVLAMFLGGSRLYIAPEDLKRHRTEEQKSQVNALSDWDGIIVVKTKLDILTMVNEDRSVLMKLLGIEREESADGRIRVPNPSSQAWSEFDAVRFAGYDADGAKRSVKILSMEYFSQSKTSLNILSTKDRRVYETVRPGSLDPIISYRIQQGTSISENLLILHDQWIYTTCDHQQTLSGVAFGVTADLLVSGVCLIGRDPYGREMKQKILAHYSMITGELSTIQSFAKISRFSCQYIDWLIRELSDLQGSQFTGLLDQRSSEDSIYTNPSYKPQLWFCNTSTTRSAFVRSFSSRTQILSLDTYHQVERGDVSEPLETESSIFTSNSNTYHVRAQDSDGKTIDIFCKQSKYAKDELQGAWLASVFYPCTAIPRMSSSGSLLYAFFWGETESDIRLSYIYGGRKDWKSAEMLFHIELVKAEDTLRAYRNSLTQNTSTGEMSRPNLQRFYYARLVNNRRLYNLYVDNIQLLGESIPLRNFLETPWIINGEHYSSLNEVFDTALKTLSPSSLQASSRPVAFGLGDAHGGNIMIAPKTEQRKNYRYLFVDYEVAGLHPVLLDLAKPFYNDVFFETLYSDLTPGAANIEGMTYRIAENTLVLDFMPQVDPISQAVLDLKLRYLIKPLCDETRQMGDSLDNHVPILANALLLCATLTRKLTTEAAFLHNFATGIILSKARNWEEFGAALEKLGFVASSVKLSVESVIASLDTEDNVSRTTAPDARFRPDDF